MVTTTQVQICNQHNVGTPNFGQVSYRMAQADSNLDHDIPLLPLPAHWAKSVVGLLSFICFANSYNGDFVFDDSEAIINNKDLRAETPLGELWHHDFWGSKLSSNTSHKSYRPLTVLTFRINYLLAGGFYPLGFHVVNIILHCAISVLIVDVFSILLGGLQYTSKGRRLNFVPKSSLLAALLFAVHPVHTECIAGIVGRADLLCALFFLLSFLGYCKAFRESKEGAQFSTAWVLLSVLLGALAMLCKEQGITILGLNALFDAVMINKLNILEVLLKILRKDKSLESLVVFRKGLLFRMTLLLSGGATMLYVRWRIMGTGPPAFTEVDNPASFADSIFVRVHYNVGKNLADKGNQTAAINYYREAVRLNPKYVHAMNNLGNILKERNELHEAEELLSLAVQIQPDFAAAWMNLGIVQNSLRRYGEAEQSYWTAIRHRKKYPDCYYNLGRLYADLNRHIDALNAWRNATVLKPQHSLAWNNMIILLDNTGNLAQAEAVGREALELIPNDHSLMFSLANVLGKSQKYKESEALFHKAIKANPTAASYHGNLAVLYHRWGNLDLAKKHYEISLKLDPTAAGTRENYSLLKRKLDQLKKKGDV
ncbi:protein O-mannosyl-transferase TMTC4 isoform X1 [Podarcis lilfordi]|uniref:Protein O-mannosyl-transferase TMTC4 isoform X1 n=1 Tax=Podarcis lilfordi TaxID=74358 RepID=A0AA35P1A3_9SAUR|nr:protein O-mannosyl-transferase TMTC4 isoform X1 [Podarcis lilfordi]